MLLFSMASNAQRYFEGVVVEKKTGKPIPFASVTLKKERVSVIAGEKGRFKLVSRKNLMNDTLLVTAVGYRSLRIPVGTTRNFMKCELEEDVQALKEVTVSSKKRMLKMYVLDGFYLDDIRGQGGFACPPTQIARMFETKTEFAILNTVKFARSYSSKLYNHPYEKAKFRIRIYDIDSVGKPGNNLCKEIIEINDTKSPMWDIVFLRKYNIIIPNRKFFIAIEWLRIGYNEHYDFNFALAPVDFERSGKVPYTMKYIISYNPYLIEREMKVKKGKAVPLYSLNDRGEWEALQQQDVDIALSATILN